MLAVRATFEEIDRRPTPMGEISLRRRVEPTLKLDVYEVQLGGEFLMSSLFTVAEIALAELALGELNGAALDVVVGGLGLGYTARAVLEDVRVRSLDVVEALGEVIGWHQQHLLPSTEPLTVDPRCALIRGDFFDLVATGAAFGARSRQRCHAILVDIDHSPERLLQPSHSAFYTREGLRRLAGRLHPGGVFALWSDDPPETSFMAVVADVFVSCDAHVVTFPNPYTDHQSANTVYVARTAPK